MTGISPIASARWGLIGEPTRRESGKAGGFGEGLRYGC